MPADMSQRVQTMIDAANSAFDQADTQEAVDRAIELQRIANSAYNTLLQWDRLQHGISCHSAEDLRRLQQLRRQWQCHFPGPHGTSVTL